MPTAKQRSWNQYRPPITAKEDAAPPRCSVVIDGQPCGKPRSFWAGKESFCKDHYEFAVRMLKTGKIR